MSFLLNHYQICAVYYVSGQYTKVGFRWIKTVYIDKPHDPDESGDEYIMILPQAEFTALTA